MYFPFRETLTLRSHLSVRANPATKKNYRLDGIRYNRDARSSGTLERGADSKGTWQHLLKPTDDLVKEY
jgi:hypothetical protein